MKPIQGPMDIDAFRNQAGRSGQLSLLKYSCSPDRQQAMQTTDIQAVIFDCDGTLVDSEKLSLSILIEYIAEFGLAVTLQDALQRWAGAELPKVFEEIEHRLGRSLPDDHMDEFRSRQFDCIGRELEVIEGAHEVLDSLRVPFCVASNAPLKKIQLCLRTTRLDRFFDPTRVLSAYEVGAWKPEPTLFLEAASIMCTDPARCAVVEDSEFGIKAGIAAGMQVYAFDPHMKLRSCESVTVTRSLRELIPIFSNRGVI